MNHVQAVGNKTPSSADDDEGLTGGEIAGIVIGSVVGALLLCLLVRFAFQAMRPKGRGQS